MYVGDSITDGVDTWSWRWQMHKVLVDNGISYTEAGVRVGTRNGSGIGQGVGANYGGVIFDSRSSAHFGTSAFEISGMNGQNGRGSCTTAHNANTHFNGTNIRQWLDQEPGGGAFNRGSAPVDTFIILIGTNDLLSGKNPSINNGQSGNLPTMKKNLLGLQADGTYSNDGDMDIIVQAMRTNNSSADIVVLTVPTWYAPGRANDFRPVDLQNVVDYNQALRAWGDQKGVTVVQSDKGIIDVANTTWVGAGVETMFRNAGGGDRVHLTNQGDLLFAGNVAKALGYAGRTAGQTRKGGADFVLKGDAIYSAASKTGSVSSSLTFASGSSLTYTWGSTPEGGFSAEFSISSDSGVGNGSTGGWTTGSKYFSVSVGNGVLSGTLNIDEAYIRWGSTILYSLDTSTDLTDSIRIAYVNGNPNLGLNSGFYVWLDDQLIGEALGVGSETLDGLKVSNQTGGNVTLDSLYLDDTGSWAPESDGFDNGNPLIESAEIDTDNPYADNPGVQTWCKKALIKPDTVTLSGGNYDLTNSYGNYKGITATGSCTRIYAVHGTAEGDKYVTLLDGVGTGYNGFVGWQNTSAGASDFTGNGYLRILGSAALTYGAWFGVVNTVSGGITGDLYFEFSADNLTVTGGAYNDVEISVAGAFAAPKGISGKFTMVFNAGTFGKDIIGGSVTGNSNVGSVDIYINGGTFQGNIAAGGYVGSVGERSITISGDAMVFNGTTLITAGQADAAFRKKGDGPSNNQSSGSAIVTISNVTDEGGFAQYTGTLSGGEVSSTEGATRTLVFSNSVLTSVAATLQNFDILTVSGDSEIGLTALGGATEINIGDGSTLVLREGVDLGADDLIVVNSGGTVVLENGVNLEVCSTGGDAFVAGGTFELQSGSVLTMEPDAVGAYTFDMETGATLNVGDSKVTGAAVLHGESAAAPSFDLGGGLASGVGITLHEFTADARVTNMGSGEINLVGENTLALESGKNATAEEAILDFDGSLGMLSDATLRISTDGIVAEARRKGSGELSYYLTNGGDITGLASGGKVVVDSSMLVLGWEMSLSTDGRIVFTNNGLDGEIYESDSDNSTSGEWVPPLGNNIYDDADRRKAVLVNNSTSVDLSEESNENYEERGFILRNLMGTEKDADLTVQGDSTRDIRVTITNELSTSTKKALEDKTGITVENSLTFKGNINISDATLQVEHLEADSQTHAPDSTTIVEGNVRLSGQTAEGVSVRMKSGVLELRGKANDFGAGAVEFTDGYDSQVVVNGIEGGKLTVAGQISATEGSARKAREHVKLVNGGEFVLSGATVGDDVVIGNTEAEGDTEAVAGTLTVAGAAGISESSTLSNVLLQLTQGSTLTITGAAPAPVLFAARAAEPAAEESPVKMSRILTGLEGSGSLVTDAGADADVGGEAEYIAIRAAGSDHVFSGDLQNYRGTMVVYASSYTQEFSGVQGGKDWSLVNTVGGQVVLNLMGGSGSNELTMGNLVLQSYSTTTILMDLTPGQMRSGGLHLTNLAIEDGATVNVGHYSGTITLEGEEGGTYFKRIGVLDTTDEAYIGEGVIWNLVGVRNMQEVKLLYDNGVLYLTGVLDGGDDHYSEMAYSGNAAAGAALLWSLGGTSGNGDLAAVDGHVLALVKAAETDPAAAQEVNRIFAAVAGSSTAVVGQALSADMERQLRAMRNRASSMGYDKQTDDKLHLNTWLNAETNYHKQDADGMLPGFKTNGWGGTVGLSFDQQTGTSIGLALTAMYNDIESDGPDRLKGDMDVYYLTGLLQMTEGSWRHTLVCSVGASSVDTDRTVDYGAGSYTVHGSTDGISFGLMYEVSYTIPMSEDASVRVQPLFNISWRYNQLDAYSETGSDAALHVGEQTYNALTLGLGARVQAAVGQQLWNRSGLLEARALVKAHAGDREGSSEVSFARGGLQTATVKASETGVLGFELGAGVTVPLSKQCDAFVDFSAELGSNHTDVNAAVGVKYSF